MLEHLLLQPFQVSVHQLKTVLSQQNKPKTAPLGLARGAVTAI